MEVPSPCWWPTEPVAVGAPERDITTTNTNTNILKGNPPRDHRNACIPRAGLIQQRI